MKLKSLMLFFLLIAGFCLKSENLIKNGEMDNPDSGECKVVAHKSCVAMSYFTEDQCWNKCVKLKVLKLYEQKGRLQLNGRVLFGGNKKQFGFAVKPNTVYNYELSLRGKGKRVFVSAVGWSEPRAKWKFKQLANVINGGQVPLVNNWISYKGAFKTGDNTKRAAISVMFWGDAKNNHLTEKPGDYVLVDNLSVLEKKVGAVAAEHEVKRILSVPFLKTAKCNWSKIRSSSTFTQRVSHKRTKEQTSIKVVAGKDKLFLMIRCYDSKMPSVRGNIKGVETDCRKIWKDDLIEVFFAPVSDDRTLTQFVVTAGGGRWMGKGGSKAVNSFDDWQAKVKKTANYWQAELEVPYKLLGYKKTPESGSLIGFNVVRQRLYDKEYTSWSKIAHSHNDSNKFGKLLFGDASLMLKRIKPVLLAKIKQLSEKDQTKFIRELRAADKMLDSQKLFNKLKRLENRIKLSAFSKRKFAVTPLNPCEISTLVPFVPDTIKADNEPIRIRGAVNEIVNLPLALTNFTNKIDEYRCILYYGEDNGIELNGLKGVEGDFPVKNIEFLRAIRVKDSEGKIHNQRFDPLVSLDDSHTVFAGPNDSALIWLQFNTKGIKPGLYKGTLRIIPLNEPASWKRNVAQGIWTYKGDILDIPFSFEVLPITLPLEPQRPFFVWRDALNYSFFKRMAEQGVRVFQVSPWYFKFKYKADGTIASIDNTRAEKLIRKQLAWAEKSKIKQKIKFAVVYSAYQAFGDLNRNLKRGSKKWQTTWKAYYKGIEDVFKKCGVKPEDCVVEIMDEPKARKFSENDLFELCTLAKQVAPDLPTMLTLDSHFTAKDFTKLHSLVDVWCFWDGLYRFPAIHELVDKLRAQGRTIWMYRCRVGISNCLYKYYRSHAWLGELRNAEVVSMYHYIPGYCGEYGATQWKIHNNGALAYNSCGKCLTSIRNECLKIGVTDLRYYKKLQLLVTEAQKKKACDSLVKQANELISKAPTEVINKNFDKAIADKFRKKAINLILQLQEKIK